MSDNPSVLNDLHTVLDFIRWSASQFQAAGLTFGHGTDNALDEANHLVLGALHLPYNMPLPYYQGRLSLTEKQELLSLVQRRVEERVPVPYLLHEAWFANMAFYVDERVLIPRSPMAELIESQFAPWIEVDEVGHVLDLCTGSGCIAVACAMAFPHAAVDAADISPDALEVAALNIDHYHLHEQIELFHSDLFDQLPPQKYDIIVSNPPYVDAEEMAALTPEYQHEPALGLAAGTDGLDIVRRILATAASYLSSHGILVVEVGISQAALEEAYPDLPFTWLEFAHGGEGVFLLTAAQLAQFQTRFSQ